VLRKEASWNSWRDKSIDNVIHENIPTSGFVLNKKVGDYGGWNHRQAYVRIYDPRDFEFEITVSNLLYILENTNSIKGKGLEGEFVHAWDGKENFLLPTNSPDYIEITNFNKILHEKTYIKSKELILGATYKTKDNQEWVYMGRFDCHEYGKVSKKYFFFDSSRTYSYFQTLKSLNDKLIGVVSEDCVGNYAEIFDKLEHSTYYSPVDDSKDEYVAYDFNVLVNKINSRWIYCYSEDHESIEIRANYQNPELFKVIVRNNNDYWNREKTVYEGTLESIYSIYRPAYKNKYLANGKLYQRGDK
jgi:hypothetical protein